MSEKIPEKILPPLGAIRAHCLWCQGGNKQYVETCELLNCELYPFRRGTNPHRKKTELTEKQKPERIRRLRGPSDQGSD